MADEKTPIASPLQWVGDAISSLFTWFADGLTWIGKLFVGVFVAAWDLLRDVPAWIFDQVLQVAVSAVQALDTSALSSAIGDGGAVCRPKSPTRSLFSAWARR